MRAVLQRVTQANVSVDGQVVGAIGQGLLVLLGIHKNDTVKEALQLAQKITAMRIFQDDQGKMNRSLVDVQGDILCVSQFTLYANTKSGRRPDFLEAAAPALGQILYDETCLEFEKILGKKIGRGIFGASMAVNLINDGPVTIIVDVP